MSFDQEVLRRAALTRRQIMRRAGLGGLALTAPGVLAACGSDKSSPGSTASGTTSNEPIDEIRWVTTDEVASLDGAKDYAGLVPAVIATEPVVIYDDENNVVGHLAESWEVADPVTYVYKVRQGVKFWDGSLMTAEDVAFAMQRHLDPKVASVLAGLIPPVESIKVTGDHEVTVKLKKPDATWEQVPTFMFVAPKAFFERLGKDYGAPKPNSVMGTGPYKVTEFKTGEIVAYVANDDYWGPKPNVRRLSFKTIDDPQVAVLAAKGGEVDGSFDMAGLVLEDWKSVPNMKLTLEPGTFLSFFTMDTEAKPWDDLHVRKALAYSLDREGLLKAITKGNADIAHSLVPRAQWPGSYPQDRVDEIYEGLTKYDFDLDKAKAELAQSAYPKGLTVPVWYYASSTTSQQICVTWRDALSQIGVKLELQAIEVGAAVERQDEHRDLEMHTNLDWGPDYADPMAYPIILLPSSAAKAGFYNEANYKNPTMDKLIKENLSTNDIDTRTEKLGQIMKMAADDLPYIPLWTAYASVAVREGLEYQALSYMHRAQSWVSHIRKA